jgi:iron complex outermembrane receptor protein
MSTWAPPDQRRLLDRGQRLPPGPPLLRRDRGAPSRDPLDFQSNPFLTSWEYKFNTKTTTGYIQDVWTVTDALKVNFGFKALKVENEVKSIVGAMNGKIESKDNFLPQVGAVYTWTTASSVRRLHREHGRLRLGRDLGPVRLAEPDRRRLHRQEPEAGNLQDLRGGVRYTTTASRAWRPSTTSSSTTAWTAPRTAPPILGLPAVLSNVGSVRPRASNWPASTA